MRVAVYTSKDGVIARISMASGAGIPDRGVGTGVDREELSVVIP